jgi:hypothetical protein
VRMYPNLFDIILWLYIINYLTYTSVARVDSRISASLSSAFFTICKPICVQILSVSGMWEKPVISWTG